MTSDPTTTTKNTRRKRRDRITRRSKPRSKPRRALHKRTNNLPDSDLERTCIKSNPIPEGYVFVPKGDPYITRNCKSRSKAAGRTVYIVYDNKLHRTQLGIRIPSQIYSSVLHTASQTAPNRALATQNRDARDNLKAQSLLQLTFPSIPAQCLSKILQHAFLKGSGRVGRISTRSDKEKATLAVEAHIRHEHTEYESLMNDARMDREAAREVVWREVKRIRDEWAGRGGGAGKVQEVEVIDLT